MSLIKSINLLITFLLELCLLVVYGYLGFNIGNSKIVNIVGAIAVPAIVALIWGLYLAPKSFKDIPTIIKQIGKGILFLLAFIGLFLLKQERIGIIFLIIYIINMILLILWKQI